MGDGNFCGDCGADSRGSCTCTQECDDCGGDGVVSIDRADGRGEHYTEERECETCGGTGSVSDDGPTFDLSDADEIADVHARPSERDNLKDPYL